MSKEIEEALTKAFKDLQIKTDRAFVRGIISLFNDGILKAHTAQTDVINKSFDYYTITSAVGITFEGENKIKELQHRLVKAEQQRDLAVGALEKYKTATSVLEPIISHQLQIVSDFEDFTSSVGGGYVSKEQHEWNKIAYDAADIIESRLAEKALKEIKGE